MSDNITVARRRIYSSGIAHLAQQDHSKFRSKVRVETDVKAKMTLWDQLGDIELLDKTARHQPTPAQEAPHERRALFTMVRHGGVLVDEADLETIMNDPTAHYGQMLSMAAGRKYDKVIINAANATSKVGEEGSTDQAMLAGNILNNGTATGMTTAKAIECKEVLDGHEVNELIPRYAFAKTGQFSDLLNEGPNVVAGTGVVSSLDHNTVAALVKGEIKTWLGFEWERSEQLNVDANADVLCLFYAKDGILLGIASDVNVRVGVREDLSYDGQVYLRMNIGATRMEEKKVVVQTCQA